MIDFIGQQIKVKFDYKNNILNNNHWLILRVNLPHSEVFNPYHKDIYQNVDNYNKVPKMINPWIPICGVNDKTGFPIVPGSQFLKESQIIRSKAGTKVNGNRFL